MYCITYLLNIPYLQIDILHLLYFEYLMRYFAVFFSIILVLFYPEADPAIFKAGGQKGPKSSVGLDILVW